MDIQKIRDQFPILARQINGRRLIYLDNAATTQKPKRVVEALVDFYYNHNANIHRGVHTLAVEATQMVDGAREKVAKFIGGKTEEIVFVRNATEGLNLAMYCLGEDLAHDQNVVVSMMEHHSNLVPWQVLCKKTGATLRVIEIDSEGRLVFESSKKQKDGYMTGGVNDVVDTQTKILALSFVSNVTGVINPIEEIVKSVKKTNPEIIVVVDASQAVGHMRVDVTKLGADLVVFSGHKMYGPTGAGVLWGKSLLLKKMSPFLYGGDMISEVKLSETIFAESPNKFEAGTPAIAEIVGLGAACDFLSDIGMDEIEKRENMLTQRLMEKLLLLQTEGIVKLVGPQSTGSRGAIVSFNVTGVHAHDLATYLDNQGVAVRSGQHCSAPLVESFGQMATARISLSFINTEEEIDFVVETLPEAYKYFVK